MLAKLTTNKRRILNPANNMDLTVLISLSMLIAICMFPEISLAADVTVEGQLDKVGTLANSKLKTVGLSIAVIISGIASVIKGNIKFAAVIVGIGIFLSLFLEWIAAGMKLTVA